MAIFSAASIAGSTQKAQSFSRHEVLPLHSDILWCIEQGAVRTLTWSEEGTSITLGYWGVGDVVGQPLSRSQPYEIRCCTSVEMRSLPRGEWQQALNAIIWHAQQAEELLSIAHRQPVHQRLWQFLSWLSQKFGRDVERGRLIDLIVTQQEIAEATNTTRVSVTRILQQFESEGLLQREKRQLILCR